LEKWRLETEAADREKERELEQKKIEVERELEQKIDAEIADREREMLLEQQKTELEKIKAETEHQRVLAEQERKRSERRVEKMNKWNKGRERPVMNRHERMRPPPNCWGILCKKTPLSKWGLIP